MNSEKVYAMRFDKIYPLLVSKAEKKGRTKKEVDEIICWLTGYRAEEIEAAVQNSVAYGVFFRMRRILIRTENLSKERYAACAWRISPSR